MTVSIRVLDDQKVLEVTYLSDEVTQENLNEQRRLVGEALSRSGLSKVLVDASSLSRLPSVFTIFNHNTAVSGDPMLWRAAFAVVFQSLGDDEEFLETTALNRGMKLRCFTSRESGLSWLHGLRNAFKQAVKENEN